ncbi:3-methyl-2-oxobutanoate hydroxymethyltransferase [Dongia soli]|uniref:3-methyl-2-oxobutanoate hydroxymethyltransferase n=1 Tax=Dongia soli TaxID=600628 RepID=A0ABU5E620_9PROT|nr:3-methyl-2-oxobutanoate hydroxymethyltransferase [Dongia soli]MDY0881648.1 3-methyl-2-oxobutanoate hydroxymethyltransferase [Dongia soli]
MRVSCPELTARKGGEPIVCLTAYTAPMAQLLDPHVDLLMVGDSLGMVLYGFDSTLPVTMDMMIAHGAAVRRGSQHACIVIDLPFGSYQESAEQAYRNAVRMMQETGCSAVKMEGGRDLAPTVEFFVKRGIPVMGHVGLMPQSVNVQGGYRARGRATDEAAAVMADAIAISEAGAFAIVVEGVMEQLAEAITARVAAPTIGIGASAGCDGQVLVVDDMLGLFSSFRPRFVKRYAELGETVSEAAQAYAADVRSRRFPGPEHIFGSIKKSS